MSALTKNVDRSLAFYLRTGDVPPSPSQDETAVSYFLTSKETNVLPFVAELATPSIKGSDTLSIWRGGVHGTCTESDSVHVPCTGTVRCGGPSQG